jgi:formyltetrahydrofolate deformylase
MSPASASSRSAILLVHCRDQRGIVAAITEFIAQNGGNILSLEQHVDTHVGEFFMRVQWTLDGFAIPSERIADFFKVLIGDRFGMDFRVHFSDERLRMAIFVSKTSHCLHDLLARVQSGELPVDVPFIAGNHTDLEPVARAHGIPFEYFAVGKDNRAEVEQAQVDFIRKHEIDVVVLARYMIILGETFIRALPERVINIHHAFLPAFIGARPYHRAYERGVKLIGATAHYVTADLDEGPIIEQDVVRVSHLDSIDELTRKGGDVEKITLARAVRRHVERKTLVYGNRVVVFS